MFGIIRVRRGGKSNIVITPTIDKSLQANTGSLQQIRFLEGIEKEIGGGGVSGGSMFCLSLRHDFSATLQARL